MTEPNAALVLSVEKLTREARHLRLEVLRMADRLEAFEDEPQRFKSLEGHAGTARAPRGLPGAFIAIGDALKIIRNVEYDLAACRTKLNQIAADPVLRADFAKEGTRNDAKAKAEKLFEPLGRGQRT